MKTNLLMDFSVDKENSKVIVKREFAASVDKVWAAWTESEILDQWWAPKPWKANTKTMDFKAGGHWLYVMAGPEGEEHWCRADFKTVKPLKGFTSQDAFCDAEGNPNTEFPRPHWDVQFEDAGASTIVNIQITFDKLADLEQYVEMGFKEGFTAALENLDEVLDQQ